MAFFEAIKNAAQAILQSKTVTAGTSATAVTPDSGYDGLSSVTVNPTPSQAKTGTPTTRSATAVTVTPDSGKLLSSVTVNTNSVPNTNSGTYTFASGDTGGTKDLGATNTYRYVNAANVYAKGKADGGVFGFTKVSINGNAATNVTLDKSDISNIVMFARGDHWVRYSVSGNNLTYVEGGSSGNTYLKINSKSGNVINIIHSISTTAVQIGICY